MKMNVYVMCVLVRCTARRRPYNDALMRYFGILVVFPQCYHFLPCLGVGWGK